MQIVAGLSLKNLKPRVWEPGSPYHLPQLRAVMVSYAEIHRRPKLRQAMMAQGLHRYLGVPPALQVYLDNGAFYFLSRGGEVARAAYEEFVERARPDWYPIAQDFIPTPQMTEQEQQACFDRTMAQNHDYRDDGYVPVIHISRFLEQYTAAVQADAHLRAKTQLALGGIVPNLLRAPKAMPYSEVLNSLQQVRHAFCGKQIHIFGMGGTATMHLAALLQMDSADSSGWRNRAARGIVQLPGRGDRVVADLGSWRGREPDGAELRLLAACACPACQQFGLDGLRATRIEGFCNRATHNLWVLLQELEAVEQRLADGSYRGWYATHLDNSIYLPLVQQAVLAM